jgi:hypothetical protein
MFNHTRDEMADKTIVHMGENSPEFVAYRLMEKIDSAEENYSKKRGRDDILKLYAACLTAVQNPHSVK